MLRRWMILTWQLIELISLSSLAACETSSAAVSENIEGNRPPSRHDSSSIKSPAQGLKAAREILFGLHSKAVMDMALTADGSLLATGSLDGDVKVWSATNGKPIRTIRVGDPVYRVALSKAGEFLVTGNADNRLAVWDTSSGAQVFSITLSCSRGSGFIALALSSDNQTIAVSATCPHVHFFSSRDGSDVGKMIEQQQLVTSMVFTHDDRGVIVASVQRGSSGTLGEEDRTTIAQWNRAEVRQEWMLERPGGGRPTLSLSRDGATFAAGAWPSGGAVWHPWISLVDGSSGKLILNCRTVRQNGCSGFMPLCLLNDRRLLLASNGANTSTWNLLNGEEDVGSDLLQTGTTCLAASKEGGMIYYGTWSGRVSRMNLRNP